MSTEDPRHQFVLEFNRLYRMWSRRNLGRKMLYAKAIAGASEKVELTPEQLKEVEDYLAGKITLGRPTVVSTKAIDVDEIRCDK